MAFGLSAGAISLIGTGVGAVTGLMGSKGGGGGGGQQVNTKEPWAEAAPWLKRQIKRGEALQDQYEADPFNAQQKTGYQNTFNDIDNYRSNIAPGIMNFANEAMTGGGFQRQRYERPGQAGYAPRQPMQPQQPQQPAGLMGNAPNGPFSVSGAGLMNEGSRYAPIDFGAQKPKVVEEKPVAAIQQQFESPEEMIRRMEEYQQRTQSDYFGRK